MKRTFLGGTELPKSCSEENKTAQEYFDQGNLKFNFKDYQEAITYYTKAIEIEPKNTMAY